MGSGERARGLVAPDHEEIAASRVARQCKIERRRSTQLQRADCIRGLIKDAKAGVEARRQIETDAALTGVERDLASALRFKHDAAQFKLAAGSNREWLVGQNRLQD